MRQNFNKIFLLFILFICCLKFPNLARAANLYFETPAAYLYVNKDFEVNLRLDTSGDQINALDVILTFNKDYLQLKSVNYNNFFTLTNSQIDNDSGKLTFNASLNNYNGSERLATLKFTPLKEGEQYVNFYCVPDSTSNDTNIWKKDNGDIVNCYNLVAGHYQILPFSCDLPAIPVNVKAVSGPSNTQITLTWEKSANADYYNIAYGPSSLNYQWGSPNVGDTNTYIVSGLNPGSPYYFIVAAVNGCGSSGALQEVASYAGSPTQPKYIQAPIVEYKEEPPLASASPKTIVPSVPATISGQLEPSIAPIKPVPSLIPLKPAFSLPKINLPGWLKVFGPVLIILLILAYFGRKLVKEDFHTSSEAGFIKPETDQENTEITAVPTVNNPTQQKDSNLTESQVTTDIGPQVPIETPQEEIGK